MSTIPEIQEPRSKTRISHTVHYHWVTMSCIDPNIICYLLADLSVNKLWGLVEKCLIFSQRQTDLSRAALIRSLSHPILFRNWSSSSSSSTLSLSSPSSRSSRWSLWRPRWITCQCWWRRGGRWRRLSRRRPWPSRSRKPSSTGSTHPSSPAHDGISSDRSF